MQYKCDFCQDTGSLNPSADLLDCGHCDTTTERIALNKWLAEQYKQGTVGAVYEMDAWRIHQRALAMAPKQEAQEPEPSLLWDAEDPEDGTHASSAADFARSYAEAAMSKGDVSEVLVLTAVRSRTRTMRIKVKDVDDGEWLEWEWIDGAAPAAANGALADADIHRIAQENGIYDDNIRPSGEMLESFARAILAAAGPDAAQELIASLISLWDSKHLLADDYIEQMSAIEHQMRALSGAKGN